MHRKYKKAQQLLEFALVLPIIMMCLMVLIETAMAFYTRMVFTDAVKMSVMQVNQAYRYGGNSSQKLESVTQVITQKVYQFLDSQNIPYAGSIAISINAVPNTSFSIVNATYTYTPFFMWGKLYNNSFIMNTSQLVNNIPLKSNSYNTFTTTNDIVGFNSPNKSTSVLLFGHAYYNCLQPISINERAITAFMVGLVGDNSHARLYSWNGIDMLPSNLELNISSGYLAIKSPYGSYAGKGFVDTTVPYSWLLASMNISQAIFVPNNNLAYPTLNQSNNNNDDISSGNYVNNYAFGLDNFSNNPISSFDPLNTSSYNGAYNYSVSFNDNNNNNVFILKLNIPNSTLPTCLKKSYSTTIQGWNGAGYDITDAYIDSDGDGIPNAWDGDPQYIDANANGIVDGQENGSISLKTTIPDEIDNYSGTGAANPSSVKMRSPLSIFTWASVQKEDCFYEPIITSVPLVKYNNAIYYYANNNIYRKVPYWSADRTTALSQKSVFTNATPNGASLNLLQSNELKQLLNGPFNSQYKVTSTPLN